MSQYITIYAKSKRKGDYIEIDSFSGNSKFFNFLEDFARYEEMTPLSSENLSEIKENLSLSIEHCKESLNNFNNRKELIVKCNNSLEEKLKELDYLDDSVEETKEELDELKRCYSLSTTLEIMLDTDRYAEEEYSYGCTLWLAYETSPHYHEEE